MRFLPRLVVAAMLGAGTGLLCGAMTYVLFGKRGPISDLAGFLAGGLSCLIGGIALWLLCARASGLLWWRRAGVALSAVAGGIFCGVGLIKYVG